MGQRIASSECIVVVRKSPDGECRVDLNVSDVPKPSSESWQMRTLKDLACFFLDNANDAFDFSDCGDEPLGAGCLRLPLA